MVRLPSALRPLRIRLPATVVTVFVLSLAIALLLTFQLLRQAGRTDVDVVLDRERERFELAVSELLAEELGGPPDATTADLDEVLRRSVRRFLALNPSTESYWTIVTFQDGTRLAAQNGPDELEAMFAADALPSGRTNVRETVSSPAGELRTTTVPVLVRGEQVATFQVVAPLAPIGREALQATGLLAAAAGMTLFLGGLLLSLTLWRALAPLQGLADAARAIELRSLAARVPDPGTDDEVAQLAREFNTMLDRLENASAHQREFMAGVSHELRTPITIARGHLELLQSLGRDDPEALEDTVAIVQDELSRMGRLVEDLLAIARSDMEDFVRPRSVELVQWFEDLELRLAGLASMTQVVIFPPPAVTLRADPDRLAQAVLNLVTNARLHTPDGTTVRVRAHLAEASLILEVADDGPGIPPDILDDVFDPFVRAGDDASSTGLGLAVVRAVIDAHGGRIELESDEHGTRVALVMPWEPASPELAGPDAPPHPGAEAGRRHVPDDEPSRSPSILALPTQEP
jgi:two-component system, OmpR family, sensor kinase